MKNQTEVLLRKISSLASDFSLSHAIPDVLKLVRRSISRELETNSVKFDLFPEYFGSLVETDPRVGEYLIQGSEVEQDFSTIGGDASAFVIEKGGKVYFRIVAFGDILGIVIVESKQSYDDWPDSVKQTIKIILKFTGFTLKSCQNVELMINEQVSKVLEKERHRLENTAVELEKASRNQNDFLSQMSHELRTPLNAIIGIANQLGEEICEPGQQDQLRVLNRASEGLLELINDILDVNKISAGEIKLVENMFRLDELLQDCVDIVRPKLSSQVLLYLDIETLHQFSVVGDAFRLKQILLNVLGNAVKYTKEGKITLKVIEGSQNRFIFSALDTGPGVPHDRRKAIFDRFGQADRDSSVKYGGVGLGLNICKSLLNMMGGEIWVEDNPYAPSGANFMFEVQLGVLSSNLPKSISNSLEGQVQSKFLESQKRILVVEDAEDNRFIMKAYFKKTNFLVDYAVDGAEGFKLFSENVYDMILMDIQMPVLDGYQASKLIREHEQKVGCIKTPIIALTANALDVDMQKITESGIDMRVTKPVHKSTLFASIQKMTNR